MDHLEAARAIVLEHLQGLDAEVFLYGSWARGTASHVSDIDIGVLPNEPIPTRVWAALRQALEESSIPYPVEIVDLSGAPELREAIREEAVAWSA